MPATLTELFSRQVSTSPDRTALVTGSRRVSYGELDAASSRLAHRLRAIGVGPEVRVAIVIERSVELVEAILGILKAGGAYVPIDPSYPVARQRYMLANSGARACVSLERLTPTLVSSMTGELDSPPVTFIAIDGIEPNDPGAPPVPPLGHTPHPSDLAYLIYTSGSTGEPKGVLVEHGHVISSLRGLEACFPTTRRSAWLFKSNHTFDASLVELFGPMWRGGCAVLLPPGAERDPQAIVDAIDTHQVTHAFFVPSAMHALLDLCGSSDLARLDSLDYLLVGGEAMTLGFAERLRSLPIEARIANVYGPTETAIICTACMLDDAASAATVPIGSTLRAVTAHVLDEARRPVSDGSAGELYIGGPSVARGYLDAPALTAERFINSPLDPTGRLYKTGDRCRIVDRGQIEFLGRVDRQVKIRGFRIELGEIEVALAGHPAVRDAVVSASGIQGDVRLTACCTPSTPGDTIDPQELRAFLGRSLPDHMIPTAWTQMAALPLNENGKIDRAAPAASTVAGVWAEELGVPALQATDDFFALGGHSLAAARVITRLRTTFGKVLTITDLYRAPTLSEFEALVTAAPPAPVGAPDPVGASGGDAARPLSYEQFGYWVYTAGRRPHLNVVGRLRVHGVLDRDHLATAVARAVAAHPALRYRIGSRLPVQYARPATDRPADVAVRDLTALDALGLQAATLGSFDELAARDEWPTEAPLIDVRLLQLPGGESEVQIALPHLVSDEASLLVLFEDLSRHYTDVRAGLPAPPAPALDPTRQFVAEERSALDRTLGASRQFWESYFQDASRLVFPDCEVTTSPTRNRSVYLDVTDARLSAVSELARSHALGIAELLQAATLIAVAPYFEPIPGHARQAVAFAPRSLRDTSAYARAVGLFVRVDGLKANVDDMPDLTTLARRLRRNAVETEPHQRAPMALKGASLQKWRWRTHRLRDLFSRILAPLLSGATRRGAISRDVVLAYARLASMGATPASDFALLINVLNSLLTPPPQTAFGLRVVQTNTLPTLEPPVRRVLEVYFLRDPSAGNTPLVMLNGALSESFRRQLGVTILDALDAACHRPGTDPR